MKWKKIILAIALWIVAYIFFNLIGIDELIDWNEFILQEKIAFIESFQLTNYLQQLTLYC